MRKSGRHIFTIAVCVSTLAISLSNGIPAHAFSFSQLEHSAKKRGKQVLHFVEKGTPIRESNRRKKGILSQSCINSENGKCLQKSVISTSGDTYNKCTRNGVKAGLCAKKGDRQRFICSPGAIKAGMKCN